MNEQGIYRLEEIEMQYFNLISFLQNHFPEVIEEYEERNNCKIGVYSHG